MDLLLFLMYFLLILKQRLTFDYYSRVLEFALRKVGERTKDRASC